MLAVVARYRHHFSVSVSRFRGIIRHSRAMDKRFQVFVSSTFRDLQEERQEIMQALLELDCIPSGMELFPAANDDQWTLIKRVIDDCDYYIVVVGGRYGSEGPEGLSFTEMEYRYAVQSGKPVIGFLHRTPGSLSVDRSETAPEARAKLDNFRSLVQQKMCGFWESPSDLGSRVSRSVVQLIKATPAVGWIRADHVGENASAEILRLRTRIEELEAGIESSRTTAPPGTRDLSQNDDLFEISFTFVTYTRDSNIGTYGASQIHAEKFTASWNEIFSAVAPIMISEATESAIRSAMNSFVVERNFNLLRQRTALAHHEISELQINERHFQTIKVQLRALGLIAKSTRTRSVKDTATYLSLTPYGDSVMTRLCAIRQSDDSAAD